MEERAGSSKDASRPPLKRGDPGRTPPAPLLSSPRPSQSATYGEGRSLHATGPEVAAWTETALSTSVPCGHNPRQAPVRLEEGASVPGARTATCEGDSYFEDCCVFFSLSLRVA